MKIKMLVMDVDGTLTDGRIYVGNHGEMMKAFDVKDGYGIVKIEAKGIVPVIITGRESKIVEERAKELHIKELHQGVENKLEKLNEIAKTYDLSLQEVAYIGDDLNDFTCMQCCGFSACPCDAVEEVRENVDYVCQHSGGHGAVREFIQLIMKDNII